MNNITISIFGNQIFSDILNELKTFSEYKIKSYDDFSLCMKDASKGSSLVILFASNPEVINNIKVNKYYFPLILITQDLNFKDISSNELYDKINMPFNILNFKKKIISLLARYEFSKRSLINLGNYSIDKNERKIKKDNIELQLTEKEINFLILFSQNDKPVTKNFLLKNVWHYSADADTHTVETHIHRLRKKILEKFNDINFIKNSDKGYFI